MYSQLIAVLLQQKDTVKNAPNDISLDSNCGGIQFLWPVIDNNNEIVDFGYVWLAMPHPAYCGTLRSGVSLKSSDINIRQFDLIKKFQKVLVTGHPLTNKISTIETGLEITLKVQKFFTGLLLWQEEKPERFAVDKTDESAKKLIVLESVAEATPDIVFLMDLETKEVLYTNRSVPLLMGYTEAQAEMMEHPIFDCMFPPDLPRMLKHLDDFKNVKDGEVREIEYRLINANGELHWYLDRNTVFKRNGAGIVTEKIGIAQEITQRKLQEEKINKLNTVVQEKYAQLESANEELDAFNNVAANYYKEVLRNLYTSMEFIISNDARTLSNEGRANLRRSQSAIQKAKLFTEDILVFSGIKNIGQVPVKCDLNGVLDGVVKELHAKIESAQIIISHDDLPVVSGYADMLSLLFTHLINNAVKFRKEDSASASRLKITQKKKIGYNIFGNTEEVYCISFSDNGIGFSDEFSNDIFSLFLQLNKDSKYKGSGIGLAVCKKIMDLHKGTISATGTPGGGAVISICFPV